MRASIVSSLILALALGAGPVQAQDAEQLRRELEQIKKQFDAMKEGYQKAIDSSTRRWAAGRGRSSPTRALGWSRTTTTTSIS